jgi:hypothetical protein
MKLEARGASRSGLFACQALRPPRKLRQLSIAFDGNPLREHTRAVRDGEGPHR